MDISIKQGGVFGEACDLLVLSIFSGKSGQPPTMTETINEVDKAMGGALVQFIKADGFEGKFGEWLALPTLDRLKAKRVAVIGLGSKEKFDADAIRKIGAWIVKRAQDVKAPRVVTTVPGIGSVACPVRDAATALGEGLRLGAYRFHAYKGKTSADRKKHAVKTVTVCVAERAKLAPAERGLEDARILSDATNFARDLVNTPSADMTPSVMADVATSLATRGSGITVKILDAEKMERLGMRAALAVGRGSQHAPVGVHLMYKPTRSPSSSPSNSPSAKRSARKIALVGKAVTFDSGGLSLKTADGMMTMKCDMGGAAAVLGVFKALPLLKPNVEVHGIFLAVENMPSGTAYRPGDVVTAMNGTTIEILNTDAEGRVTLADALTYAEKLQPDAIVDLATLTGAIIVALGEEIGAVMSPDAKLANKLLTAAKEAGEALWEMPLFEPYRDLVKSKIADIKNTGGGRWGGAITAGLFLSHFVGKTPWAHMDIAGPAYMERESRPDTPYGGTGYGVRTIARYLQGL